MIEDNRDGYLQVDVGMGLGGGFACSPFEGPILESYVVYGGAIPLISSVIGNYAEAYPEEDPFVEGYITLTLPPEEGRLRILPDQSSIRKSLNRSLILRDDDLTGFSRDSIIDMNSVLDVVPERNIDGYLSRAEFNASYSVSGD